jgi:hypothetical protein
LPDAPIPSNEGRAGDIRRKSNAADPVIGFTWTP